MATLILLRHGESMWNKKNLFTGWVDVPLSEKGIQEAMSAGHAIQHIPIDVVFCSSLIRSQMTAMIALIPHHSKRTPIIQHAKGRIHDWAKIASKDAEQDMVPVYISELLNERMYGELQGLNKAETEARFGKEQVKIWRRSYDIAPPQGESLEMTQKRVMPHFHAEIAQYIKNGQNVLVSAHGNSLRAIIQSIENMTKEEILAFEIPTGAPIIYEYVSGQFIKKNTHT